MPHRLLSLPLFALALAIGANSTPGEASAIDGVGLVEDVQIHLERSSFSSDEVVPVRITGRSECPVTLRPETPIVPLPYSVEHRAALTVDVECIVSPEGDGGSAFELETELGPLAPGVYEVTVQALVSSPSARARFAVSDPRWSVESVPAPTLQGLPLEVKVSGVDSCPESAGVTTLGDAIIVDLADAFFCDPPPPPSPFERTFQVDLPLPPGTHPLLVLPVSGDTESGTLPVAASVVEVGSFLPCQAPFAMCLGGFRVEASWRLPGSAARLPAIPQPLSTRSGSFWFFDPAVSELFVKVLDGCGVPGLQAVWVFASGLTDLDVELTVTAPDGSQRRYGSPEGEAFPTVRDVGAFPCSARP